ncbi:hypothetical protein H5410_040134 [Solanum commersonii]|uniref:Uncharacterized protein n=1 Tax=Solanum commersonii TaxID=4109 RepID=A0A9J5XQH3_SOLCO|nr:hypothetical protein H5410_040134 [Solanum commersonii]
MVRSLIHNNTTSVSKKAAERMHFQHGDADSNGERLSPLNRQETTQSFREPCPHVAILQKDAYSNGSLGLP